MKARDLSKLIPYEKALQRVLTSVSWRLGAESAGLDEALFRVLREDVRAGIDIPGFDKSAMDGYAVKASDTAGASEQSPAVLEVVLDLPAGKSSKKGIEKGRAARIMTGAPMPPGADAVVMVEYTEMDDVSGAVRIFRGVKKGENAGKAGEDVKKGSVVLKGGSVIRPAHAGMIASLGRTRVKVSRRPRVAVISTGDEVQAPGRPRKAGQIYDANGYSLTALAREQECDAHYLGICRDRPEDLKRMMARAGKSDAVLLTGGVSVGDYDFVTGLLRSLGISEVFYKSFIQPGMPTFAGRRGRTMFFGLPGNPVSCMVCFELFARPALDRMTGKSQIGMPRGKAFMDVDFKVKPGRRKLLRASVIGSGPEIRVAPYRDQKSGVLSSMTGAHVLIDVPGETAYLEAGEPVDVWWLRECT